MYPFMAHDFRPYLSLVGQLGLTEAKTKTNSATPNTRESSWRQQKLSHLSGSFTFAHSCPSKTLLSGGDLYADALAMKHD